MDPATGSWYVRLPDGRVVLAHSTQAVRYHIERGRIPANSRVRRSAEEKWQTLEATADFADLLAPPAAESRDLGKATNKAAVEFRVFGVAALVNELFNAVDLTLHRRKLWTTVAAALVWAVGLIAWREVRQLTTGMTQYGALAAIGVVLLFVAGLAGSALAQMTVVEMLHRRHALWPEIRPRLLANAWNILLSLVFFAVGVWLPLWGLRNLHELFENRTTPESLKGLVLSLRLVFEIFILPVAGLGLLLAPIIVVEECSLPKALAAWWKLLRSDLSRIFLYETLAVALGVVFTLPLLFPVLFTAGAEDGRNLDQHLAAAVSQATLHVVGAIAVTPFAAYLVVANVFIYLNLRYEFYSPNR